MVGGGPCCVQLLDCCAALVLLVILVGVLVVVLLLVLVLSLARARAHRRRHRWTQKLESTLNMIQWKNSPSLLKTESNGISKYIRSSMVPSGT